MTRNTLTNLIEKHQETIVDEKRDYIGASIIGSDCYRQIWYEYKGYPSEGVPPKTRRVWGVGKRLEGLILDWLSEAGLDIKRTNVELHSKTVEKFQGHVDSVLMIKTAKAIIEIKTAKDASFNIFVSKGLKKWNPQYYAQIQAYMGMSGINGAYILVLNKNNCELSDEFVLFDWEFYKSLEEKAAIIVSSVSEPPKINGSPLWFQCKCCKFNKVCHEK